MSLGPEVLPRLSEEVLRVIRDPFDSREEELLCLWWW
jgi:hypothetical protein